MEIGRDVSRGWRAGVEGDVLVAGAFVDGERDEGGGHLDVLGCREIGADKVGRDVIYLVICALWKRLVELFCVIDRSMREYVVVG